jgi:hypothetical protein
MEYCDDDRDYIRPTVVTSDDMPDRLALTIPESDPFRETLPKNLEVLMLRLRPNRRDLLWVTLQTLYAESPNRFTIISSLHQNDANDRLHYSVAVRLLRGSLTFHVYGYWKTMFQITDVTIADNTNEVLVVVSFVKLTD